METECWLADTRLSYDTVAASYADHVRGLLEQSPYDQAVFALFAESLRAGGGGPVVDVGCGPGRITAHLRDLGLDASGIDLSPVMVELARKERPDMRFEVGSMTDLALSDGSVAGLAAWYSIIHVPDDDLDSVLIEFRRVLRPGGLLLLGFHVGDTSRLKTEGYGGHPMRVYVHRRQPHHVAARLSDVGFDVEAEMVLRSPESASCGGVVFARCSVNGCRDERAGCYTGS